MLLRNCFLVGALLVHNAQSDPSSPPTPPSPPTLPPPTTLVPDWVQLGDDIDGEMAEWSGSNVAISSNGGIVAIGSDNNGNDDGNVRVYSYNASATHWSQMGADISESKGQGISISGDGSILAIAAYWNHTTRPIRVFAWDGTTWVQRGSAELYGSSISLSSDGQFLAIGIKGWNGNQGVAYTYEWNDATSEWIQNGNFSGIEGSTERCGFSVSLSDGGNMVAISSPGYESDTGRVRVFGRNASTWTQFGPDIVGVELLGELLKMFGGSISLSGDYTTMGSESTTTLAVGIPNKHTPAGDDSGQVQVFRLEDVDGSPASMRWNLLGSAINGGATNDHAGRAVSLSENGNTLGIGASWNENGYTRLYRFNGTTWTQLGSEINGEDSLSNYDGSGFSVALSADATTVVIGAPFNREVEYDVEYESYSSYDSHAHGHARVYRLYAVSPSTPHPSPPPPHSSDQDTAD